MALFTPLDELRLSEPSHFESTPVTAAATASTTTFCQKTPVMALDEGSRRVYGVPPEYQLISEKSSAGSGIGSPKNRKPLHRKVECTQTNWSFTKICEQLSKYDDHIDCLFPLNQVPSFGYSCRLRDTTVSRYAKTKKAAKHSAARAMLHEIINKDRRTEFGIPGKTKEEAHRIVDALAVGDPRNEVGEDDPASPSAQNENFSGKLLQLCHRKKIDSPQYSHQEEGPPNDRTFITTCRVVGQEVEGVAKTKKLSKNIASQKMLAILEKGIADLNEEPDLDRVMDDDVNSTTDSHSCDGLVIDDAIAVVATILSDSKRFEAPTQEYKILENKCAFGLTQCLLKISFSKPGVPQPRITYVFPGSHSTEEGAKQQAAHGAVLLLSVNS